ncbi:Uncharacterised protein [Mycobacterium tuberculosis]|nr:Uncharacterised protein [Mycobacterium tuberculosis]
MEFGIPDDDICPFVIFNFFWLDFHNDITEISKDQFIIIIFPKRSRCETVAINTVQFSDGSTVRFRRNMMAFVD